MGFPPPDARPAHRFVKSDSISLRKLVDHPKTDVMPRVLILGTRIAKTDDEFHSLILGNAQPIDPIRGLNS